jgi:hypothetical protein
MKLEKFLHDILNHLTASQLNLEIELKVTLAGTHSPETAQRMRDALSGIQKAILEVQKLKQEFLKNNQV